MSFNSVTQRDVRYKNNSSLLTMTLFFMEAIPMCQLLTTETIKLQSNTSVFYS